jgi:hypothetical protein
MPNYNFHMGLELVISNVSLPCGKISRTIIYQKPKPGALYGSRVIEYEGPLRK